MIKGKDRIEQLLWLNFNYVRKKGYEGYDPKIYDYLPFTSRASFSPNFVNRVVRRIEIEIFRKHFPRLILPYLNFCKIDAKTVIPYGLGVFMQTYSRMYNSLRKRELLLEAKKVADVAFDMLIKTPNGLGVPNPSKGKKFKYGDGLFDDNTIYLPGGSEVFMGFYALYLTTNDKKYLNACTQIVNGFMSEFQKKKVSDNKVALDYSNTGDNSHVLNANALAMSCIAIMYKETGKEKYKKLSVKIYNYLKPYLDYENIPYAGIEDCNTCSSWFGCDVYHTGFTLRGMWETAKIFGFDVTRIISKVKFFMDDFLLENRVIIYKGIGQRGLSQDIHALAEYIRVFAVFYDFFNSKEREKYLEIILNNVEEFVWRGGDSYHYIVNDKKKLYLYMPRWCHSPMMNALTLLRDRYALYT